MLTMVMLTGPRAAGYLGSVQLSDQSVCNVVQHMLATCHHCATHLLSALFQQPAHFITTQSSQPAYPLTSYLFWYATEVEITVKILSYEPKSVKGHLTLSVTGGGIYAPP